ncbi:carbonic anhydrase-related protein 10-like [Liolophura sinensis]|uniref:carbonic anhydrase-related protein 10-like n=1 Tax=Liolophura sinensis TaxID=3198878 RepID=UPI0031597F86
MEVGDKPGKELLVISKEFLEVRYKDWAVNISGISVSNLLPDTEGYITYEGSLTQPGCYETVTWIIMNKPIYVTKKHMANLRMVNRSEKNSANQWEMYDNRRPIRPLYHRAVRTNINFPKRTPACNMERVKKYKVNKIFKGR